MRRGPCIFLAAILCLSVTAEAQFYYFGRNKIQYTDFEWQVLRTPHFNIYYYKEMEELAHRGAAYAEEAYAVLQQRFNHNVQQRIPLVFYSSHLHFQQTNTIPGFIPEGVGGFFEFLKGRVVIPCDGSLPRFAHVIRHELVHVFMHSKVNRILLDYRVPPDRFPPLWFTEGLAEYWSTTWDTQADMIVRDAVLNGYTVGLKDMYRISGTYLMYKMGQRACQDIAARYGEEKLLLLLENMWVSDRFEDVFERTVGKTFEEFDREWLYALQKEYFPKLANEDLPSGIARDIVSEGFNSKPTVTVRNGRREIYYIGNLMGYTSIYRIDADEEEAEPELVLEGERTHEFETFHPFQSKLTISSDHRLAFVTKAGETDVIHLYDIDAEGMIGSVAFTSLVVIGSPAWSPDGTRLAFSSVDKSGDNDLYIYDLGTKELTRLTHDMYDDRDPVWSPDGSSIVFSSDRTLYGEDGTHNLFEIDPRTAAVRYVTAGSASDMSPVWSPDGTTIAYTSDADGVRNIWAIDMTRPPDERVAKKVTTFATGAFDPVWGGRDDLFCTVFESSSFQIRAVEDVRTILEEPDQIVPIVPPEHGGSWQAALLPGELAMENVRYEKDYSLDIAQSQISTDPVFGTYGGAALAMSDILGNDQYYFFIYNTAQTRSELLDNFNIAISRTSLGSRVNHAYGIFRLAGNRYDLTDPDQFYYERSFGGYYVLSHPFSRFERVEAGVSLANSDKDIYIGIPRRALLLSNSLTYVWDTSLWGPSGPLDGDRLRVTLAYTNDIQFYNVGYYTLIADYRHYQRLTRRSAWATRAHLWYNEGVEARRFFMGGSWDLRGWPRWSIRGQKIWLASQELRFPLVDRLLLQLPIGTLGLGSIRGAIYTDVGSAWDTRYRDTKGSVGFGFRWNLGGVLVLRYDIGKRIEKNLSRFQKGLFYQFFFGWDF